MVLRQKRAVMGPDKRFLLTTKPFSRASRMPKKHYHSFQIVIRRAEEPFSSSIDQEMRFLAECMGIFNPLSEEKSAFKLFKEIVRSSEKDFLRSSTDLAEAIHLSRTATINQLNNMVKNGLVVKRGQLYGLRSRTMLRTIEEIEEDMDRVFAKLKKHAKEIDEELQ